MNFISYYQTLSDHEILTKGLIDLVEDYCIKEQLPFFETLHQTLKEIFVLGVKLNV